MGSDAEGTGYSPEIREEMQYSAKRSEIKDERDYAIRKGMVLERFKQEFFTRYRHNTLYTHVLEMLIRDADPYEIIEKLIEINDEQLATLQEIMPFVSPNYNLQKQRK